MRSVLCLLLLFSINVAVAQTRLIVSGGYSLATFNAYNQSGSPYYWNDYSSAYASGWKVGALCQLPIDSKFFHEYGIQVKSIGTTLYYPHDNEKRKIQIIYLNLPANIGYKWNFTNHLKGFAGTGVYLAYGVWGKETGKGIINNGPYIIDDRVLFKNRNPSQVTPTNINPFDYGLNLFMGVDSKRVQVSCEFNRGFRSAVTNPGLYGQRFRNQSFSINAGYTLNR
jgi:hypothetical protein